MGKIGFVGFGEVNTPVDVIVRKCKAAEAALIEEGLDLVSVYPVADDPDELQIQGALKKLAGKDFDALVLCVAGWIPTHAVVKITERYRHLPMVLWGLCGWREGDRVTANGSLTASPACVTRRSSGWRWTGQRTISPGST